MEDGSLILRLKLIKQVKRISQETGEKRKHISKLNTSRFFVELYHSLYGGVINKDGRNGNIDTILSNGNLRRFSPDIVSSLDGNTAFTEIKSNSIKRSSPFCSKNQIENYCYLLLRELEEGDLKPSVNYAFFRYGNSYTKHLHKLGNSSLVDELARGDKYLTIMPLNLLFFLLAFSNLEEKDQTTSTSNINYQKYLMPRGKILRTLHESENAIQELIGEYLDQPTWDPKRRYIGNIEDFFLDKLRADRSMSPKINFKYHSEHKMDPFSITKYSLPGKSQAKWLSHFSRNHRIILDNLGLEDIFEDDIPF